MKELTLNTMLYAAVTLKKGNWNETVPGKGWFVLLRLYGPIDGWFEKNGSRVNLSC